MIDNNVYLTEPTIAITETAWDAFLVFRDDVSTEEAVKRIKNLHYAHVRRMLADDRLSADGAVIVTDIPGCDLSLVDAHFPTLKARQTTLFTRAGAAFVVGVLARRGHPIRTMVQ